MAVMQGLDVNAVHGEDSVTKKELSTAVSWAVRYDATWHMSHGTGGHVTHVRNGTHDTLCRMEQIVNTQYRLYT